MASLHAEGKYDRKTGDLFGLTGEAPTRMLEFVKRHAGEFTRSGAPA